MYVEPFVCNFKEERTDEKGNKYTFKCGSKAKDAHEDIAVEEIVAGCEALSEYASSLQEIGENITNYGELISKEDLSVDGTGVDGLVLECQASINTIVSTNIIEHVNGVKANAISVFNNLQTTYNDIAKSQCNHY